MEYVVLDVFIYFCFLSIILIQKSLNRKISHNKEKIGPMQFPRKILNFKFWANEEPTRKILDHEAPTRKKLWTHKIATRKNFGPTK